VSRLTWPAFVVFLAAASLVPGAAVVRADQRRASAEAANRPVLGHEFPVFLGSDGRNRAATTLLVTAAIVAAGAGVAAACGFRVRPPGRHRFLLGLHWAACGTGVVLFAVGEAAGHLHDDVRERSNKLAYDYITLRVAAAEPGTSPRMAKTLADHEQAVAPYLRLLDGLGFWLYAVAQATMLGAAVMLVVWAVATVALLERGRGAVRRPPGRPPSATGPGPAA
jgi:hypothetical protein